MAAPNTSLASRALSRSQESIFALRLLPALAAALLATLLVSLVCVAFVPSVRDYMTTNTFWNGMSSLVEKNNAAIVDYAGIISVDPAGKTLLTVSETSYDAASLAAIQNWVADGGRLVVMDDYGQGNELLQGLGLPLRFSGLTLLDPLFCYKKPELPRLTDLSPDLTQAGITAITLNHATTISGAVGDQVLARSSDQSYVETPGAAGGKPIKIAGPFVAAAKVNLGRGKVYVLADSSLIINSMLALDNNRAFIDLILGSETPGSLYIDATRLNKGPLDYSKTKLDDVRAALSRPAALTGLVLFITLVLSLVLLRKGQSVNTQNHGGDYLA